MSFELPRQFVHISAMRSGPAGAPNKVRNPFDVIHLNGKLEDLPENVTFSLTQYAERIAKPDPWYIRLTSDLLSRPFVFIGTSLNEPPLWQHIEIRRERGGRGTR